MNFVLFTMLWIFLEILLSRQTTSSNRIVPLQPSGPFHSSSIWGIRSDRRRWVVAWRVSSWCLRSRLVFRVAFHSSRSYDRCLPLRRGSWMSSDVLQEEWRLTFPLSIRGLRWVRFSKVDIDHRFEDDRLILRLVTKRELRVGCFWLLWWQRSCLLGWTWRTMLGDPYHTLSMRRDQVREWSSRKRKPTW